MTDTDMEPVTKARVDATLAAAMEPFNLLIEKVLDRMERIEAHQASVAKSILAREDN